MDFYHLLGASLAVGSIIEPGNFGRIVRALAWQHGHAFREMALEDARLARFPHRPSRLDCAFCFITDDEARRFRTSIQGFAQHILYRVSLVDPKAASHVTDHRFCTGQGTFRANWADIYWMDFNAQAAAVPGINWTTAKGGHDLREMLTLSQVRIEERLN